MYTNYIQHTYLQTTHYIHTCKLHITYIPANYIQHTYLQTTHYIHTCKLNITYIPANYTLHTYLQTTHYMYITCMMYLQCTLHALYIVQWMSFMHGMGTESRKVMYLLDNARI